MQVNVSPSNLPEEAVIPADLVPSAARPPGRDEVTVAEAGEYLKQYLTRETVCSHYAAYRNQQGLQLQPAVYC